MHYMHRVVVVADDEDEAIAMAEGSVEPYQGPVWDWYTVGGRWNGALNGKNALRYTDDPKLFAEEVEAAYKAQNADYLRYRRMVSGEPFTQADVPEWITSELEKLGESQGSISDRSQAWIDGSNESLKKDHEGVKAVLGSASLSEAWDAGAGRWLASHYLKKMTQLVDGSYTSDSHFFDGRDGEQTSKTRRLQDYIRETEFDGRTEELERLWMVVIDMHN
jgi:hypothetical protein